MSRLNLPVEEFTSPNPITASEETAIDELFELMRIHEIHHIPIVRNRKVVGIVSDRDLRVAWGLNQRQKQLVHAKDIMAENPVSMDAETSLDQVAFEMSQRKIGSIIVTENNDDLVGIFTVTDALNALIEISRS